MKNLSSRIGMLTGLAVGSIFSGGCTGQYHPPQDPGLGLAILGAAAGARGSYLGAQGDLRGALSSEALGNVAGGMADYERQKARAEAGRSQVIINNGQPQANPIQIVPAQTILAQPPQGMSDVKLYLAADLDHNGIIDITETIKEQYDFTPDQKAGVSVINATGRDRYVRISISQNGKTIVTSEFLDNKNGTYRIWSGLAPIGKHLSSEGDYEVIITDNQGNSVGRKIFNIKP